MPGVTKRIYIQDLNGIDVMWTKCIDEIKGALPFNYTKEDVVFLLKKYFPHEFDSVIYKKKYYDTKDRFLMKRYGRKRFCMPEPIEIIYKNRLFIKITSLGYKKFHNENYSDELHKENILKLDKKRCHKIKKVNNKIAEAKLYTQSVTPFFIDKLIGYYERKNSTHKDKVYILLELKKYFNEKVINFFFKLNDTELNKQLRHEAFYHLQSFNYQPRLRKQKYIQIHSKNKKRKGFLRNEYPSLTFKIPKTPEELEYRIFNGKEQVFKEYDFFVSHSSKDSYIVMKLKEYKNNLNKFVFCDWINDNDYLKRELLSSATLNVIEHRLDRSKEMIFVKTENSLKSEWCLYELNYFHQLGKRILFVNGDDIINNRFIFSEYPQKNYYNPNYKNLLSFQK